MDFDPPFASAADLHRRLHRAGWGEAADIPAVGLRFHRRQRQPQYRFLAATLDMGQRRHFRPQQGTPGLHLDHRQIVDHVFLQNRLRQKADDFAFQGFARMSVHAQENLLAQASFAEVRFIHVEMNLQLLGIEQGQDRGVGDVAGQLAGPLMDGKHHAADGRVQGAPGDLNRDGADGRRRLFHLGFQRGNVGPEARLDLFQAGGGIRQLGNRYLHVVEGRIVLLLGDGSGGLQFFGTLEVPLGQVRLGLGLVAHGFGDMDFHRLQDARRFQPFLHHHGVGLELLQGGQQIAVVQFGKHVPGLDAIPFHHLHGADAARHLFGHGEADPHHSVGSGLDDAAGLDRLLETAAHDPGRVRRRG